MTTSRPSSEKLSPLPPQSVVWRPPGDYDPVKWGLLLRPGQKVRPEDYFDFLTARFQSLIDQEPEARQLLEERLIEDRTGLPYSLPARKDKWAEDLLIQMSPLKMYQIEERMRDGEPGQYVEDPDPLTVDDMNNLGEWLSR